MLMDVSTEILIIYITRVSQKFCTILVMQDILG